MFNNLNPQQPSNSATNAVDDIFAETDNSAARPAAGNNGSNGLTNNIEAQPAGLSAQPYADTESSSSGRSGAKLKFILILLLSALILGAAAYLIYSKFIRSAGQETTAPVVSPTVTSTTSNPVQPNAEVVVPASEQPAETQPTSTPLEGAASSTQASSTLEQPAATETPAVTAPIDSDGDSLTDTEEEALGTKINLIDSDFDGLSDYEEVKVYKTNPLNPDSDGDGYKDGDEVKSGYNPNGAGKLQ